MRKLFASITALLLLGACTLNLLAQESWQGVERVVAVGDVHGDYDNFLQVLRQAGIVNRRGNWSAGETHLVQMGDLPDRGPDTDKAIELLRKLERQAERSGGRVHALIGNHEAMNMLGDLRYVDPGEYESFVTRDSDRMRERYYELVVQSMQQADPEFEATPEFRAQWEERIPPGYVEHRLAWAPQGEIGSWVMEHNAVIRIDRVLYLHAGVSPAMLALGLDEINAAVKTQLSLGESGQTEEGGLATDEDGPLWYRGLASNDELLEAAHVDAVLARYDVDRIVVGHTPGLGTLVPRFGGKVLVIDSGISSYYGGHLASLVIENGEFFAIQQGERLAIPTDEAGLVPYFEAVLALEPELEPLQRHLQTLRGQD